MLAIRVFRQSRPLLASVNPFLCISVRNMASVREHSSPIPSPPPSKRVKLDLAEDPVEEQVDANEGPKGR